MHLSADQLHAFALQGYLVIPNVISTEKIAIANRRVDELVRCTPPKKDHTGFHFYWLNDVDGNDPLLGVLNESSSLEMISELVAPKKIVAPRALQVSLTIPPYEHRPGAGHIDGLTPPEDSGRPGTFTCLVGVFLTDQRSLNSGNLWVWPGSHRELAKKLKKDGPDTIFENVHPKFDIAPVQITGNVGDLLICHYLLAHNMGCNRDVKARRMAYYRLRTENHAAHWRDYVCDELFEFAICREKAAQDQELRS